MMVGGGVRFVVSARGGASASVDAPNWLAALGIGLEELDNIRGIDRLACEVLMNGTVLARDARTGQGFVVRPLDEEGAADPPGVIETEWSEDAAVELPEDDEDSELIEATLVEEATSGEVDAGPPDAGVPRSCGTS